MQSVSWMRSVLSPPPPPFAPTLRSSVRPVPLGLILWPRISRCSPYRPPRIFQHTTSDSTSRADFAKIVTGAVAASFAVAAPAVAKSGTAAKQNYFGVLGADQNLGGGMSNYFAESETYSPYSPYGTPDKALYNEADPFMLKVKVDVLKDSQKRLQAVPAFIENKKWEEIRSLLTAKASFRCVPAGVSCPCAVSHAPENYSGSSAVLYSIGISSRECHVSRTISKSYYRLCPYENVLDRRHKKSKDTYSTSSKALSHGIDRKHLHLL